VALSSCLLSSCYRLCLFSLTSPSTSLLHPLSLHDALPIWLCGSGGLEVTVPVVLVGAGGMGRNWLDTIITDPNAELAAVVDDGRSEEHTSELQSRFDLVCRLLLEKKN